jgi:hypothetical protein
MIYYFDFVQFQWISLTFAFTFGAFKSLHFNFGLVRTDLRFKNFRLSDGESWKSQYRSYRHLTKRTKANRKEPKSSLGVVFNFKLGCFVNIEIPWLTQVHPHLELKTQPRLRPVSLCLSITKVILHLSNKFTNFPTFTSFLMKAAKLGELRFF